MCDIVVNRSRMNPRASHRDRVGRHPDVGCRWRPRGASVHHRHSAPRGDRLVRLRGHGRAGRHDLAGRRRGRGRFGRHRRSGHLRRDPGTMRVVPQLFDLPTTRRLWLGLRLQSMSKRHADRPNAVRDSERSRRCVFGPTWLPVGTVMHGRRSTLEPRTGIGWEDVRMSVVVAGQATTWRAAAVALLCGIVSPGCGDATEPADTTSPGDAAGEDASDGTAEAGTCVGTPEPCESFTSREPCGLQGGCYWVELTRHCVNAFPTGPTSCEILSGREDVCLAQVGCRWEP